MGRSYRSSVARVRRVLMIGLWGCWPLRARLALLDHFYYGLRPDEALRQGGLVLLPGLCGGS